MEEDIKIFSFGENDDRLERKVKKGQVKSERLAQMFGVSKNEMSVTVYFALWRMPRYYQ